MPNNMNETKVLLVGTGYMGREYAKVLSALQVSYDVVGRGQENCDAFSQLYPSARVFAAGLKSFKFQEKYSHAIIASSVDALYENTLTVLENGINKILLEKPGGINLSQIRKLSQESEKNRAVVLIAYNRRFYSSVRAAKQLIDEDNGVLSFNFEFTEWPHTIEALTISDDIKQNWFLANSTHVVDTAFYLGGKPTDLKTYSAESLPWHKSSAIFAGAGISERGALFNYHANWKAPGRWSVEILTEKRRLILRPMEILQMQLPRSVAINEVPLDDKLDKDFKPGLYLQTKSFLAEQYGDFCTIREHEQQVEKTYNKISSES